MSLTNDNSGPADQHPALRLAGKIAHAFIDSKLTPLVIVAALLLGAFAIMQTPREEEPQIVVPMLDVFVQMPGASSQEVAQRVSLPMEKLLREVPGVEYIYSISHPGMSMLIVRFYVGTKEEDAIIQTYNKLYSNFDRIPPGVSQPVIKVRSINDVPIMALTLWGKNYDSYRLRRVAGELENSLKKLDDVSETAIIGGQPRQVRVVLDTQRLAAYGLTPGAVVGQLQSANSRGQAGSFARDNREFQVEAGLFFTRADDLQQVVVGVHGGRPVYLRDVVEKIEDGPAEPDNYVLFASAKGTTGQPANPEYPAVTITLAKRKGTNASIIAENVLAKVDRIARLHAACGPEYHGHAKLRRDREGQVGRTPQTPTHRHAVGHSADRLGSGLARVRRGAPGRAGNSGPYTGNLLSLRLHAEPRDIVCADLLHRHPGGRCDRGRRKHRSPFPPAGKPWALAGRRRC